MYLHRNNKGFALGAVLAAMFLISSVVVLGTKATDTVRSAQRYFNSAQVKNNQAVLRDYLVQNSADPDTDGHYELPKEGAGNTIPLSIPVSPADSYGTNYRYCTWDAGAPNTADGNYSQNNVAPPSAGLIGRIISAGTDKTFQTSCTDVASGGDDVMLDIFENAVNWSSASLGGWKDSGSYISQLNPTDNIGVGTTAPPTHKMEFAAGTTAAEGLALGDVELFRSAANTLTANVTGGNLKVSGGGLQVTGGTISLINTTSNIVIFNAAGIGPPTTSPTRSAGTKVTYKGGLSPTSVDYATGIDTNVLWQSVPTSAQSFQWYAATTPIMTLDGGGHLGIGATPDGSYAINAGAINATALYVNGVAVGGSSDSGTAAGQTSYWDGSKWTYNAGVLYDPGTGALNIAAGGLQVGGAGVIDATGNWVGSVIGPTKGGTGLNGYTTGDMLYASGIDTISRLQIGLEGAVLTVSGGVPTWGSAGVISDIYHNTKAGTAALNALAGFTSDNTAYGYQALANNTYGQKNVAVGSETLYTQSYLNGSAPWDTGNVGVGYQALYKNQPTATTNGAYNVALGFQPSYSNTTGTNNIAVGQRALFAGTTGNNNTALGNNALYYLSSGNYNNAMGFWALKGDPSGFTGSHNNAFGYSTLQYAVTANNNNAFGQSAMQMSVDSSFNNAFGSAAMQNASNATNNNAFGSAALMGATGDFSGTYNNAMGFQAMYKATTADSNNAFGTNTLYYASTAYENNAIGSMALMGAGTGFTGYYNNAFGTQALSGATTAHDNNSLGYLSMKNATSAHNNNAFGSSSLLGSATTGFTGYYNNVMGPSIMVSATTASYNNVFGKTAMMFASTASHNNVFGYQAAYYGSAMTDNNVFGQSAMMGTSGVAASGTGNNVMGNSAMQYASSGNYNNVFGASALRGKITDQVTGSYNNAFGLSAMFSATSAHDNNAFGLSAFLSSTTGYSNNAFGSYALYFGTTASYNNAFGFNALYGDSTKFTGSNNNAFGYQPMYYATTAQHNNAFGYQTLYGDSTNKMTGSNNNAFGQYAMTKATSASDNNAFGSLALRYASTSTYNNAMGQAALQGAATGFTGSYNNAFGRSTLFAATTATYNNAFGANALYSATSASDNNAFGHSALNYGTTATCNNAMGLSALRGDPAGFTGNDNNAFGQSTLYLATSAANNNAFGALSLRYATTAIHNNAMGNSALQGDATGFTGSYNNAFGFQTMKNATSATNNNIFGGSAGLSITTETYNTLIGDSTNLAAGVSYGTALGAGSLVTTSNTVVLGRTTDSVAIGATTANDGTQWKLYVGGDVKITGVGWITGGVWQNSDRRLKKDISTLIQPLEVVSQLNAVTYFWINPKSDQRRQYGFIAQELEKVLPELVTTNSDGYKGVNYVGVIPWLVGAVQEMNKTLLSVSGVRVITNTTPSGKRTVWRRTEDNAALFSATTDKEGDDSVQGYLSAKDVYLADQKRWASEKQGGIKFLPQPIPLFNGAYTTAYTPIDASPWVPKDAAAVILSVETTGDGSVVAARSDMQSQEYTARSGQIIVPLANDRFAWQARLGADGAARVVLAGWSY